MEKCKAASAENAISGFKASGVVPFNPGAIPDYAFFDSDAEPNSVPNSSTSSTMPSLSQGTIENEPVPGTSTGKTSDNWTPSRILKDISPIPQKLIEARKRSKQVGKLLTSDEHITTRRSKEKKKEMKENKRTIKQEKNIAEIVEKNTHKPRKYENEKLSDKSLYVVLMKSSQYYVTHRQMKTRKMKQITVLSAAKIIIVPVLLKIGFSV